MTNADVSSISALGELISAKATVLRIEPGDILILSNTGPIAPEYLHALTEIRDLVCAARIYTFPEDIDVAVLRPSGDEARTTDDPSSP